MAREISISFALNAALGAGFKTVFQSASQSARNVASAIREMEKSPVGNLGATMASQREKIKGLAGSIKEAKATLAGLQSQATQASAPFLALNAKFEQGKERAKGLAGSLKAAKSDLDNLKKQALASAASMNSLKAQIVEARGKVGELSAGLKEEKTALAALRAQKKAVGDSTGVLSVQIAQAETRIASLSSRLGAAKTNLAGLQGKEQAAAAATNALKAQAISAKDAVANLSASLKEEKNSLAALKSQVSNAARSIDDLKSEVAQAENRVKSLSGTLATQVASWRENAAQATAVSGSVHKLAGEYERLSQKIERARKVQAAQAANRAQGDDLRAQRADLNSRLAGTIATTASVALPVKLAISAEDTFADLRKVMDAPEEEMQAVFAAAQQMSNRTGKSFEDVVTIMTAAAQAGLGKTKEQLLGVADQAVKMSIAWGVSAETAGKSLATWQAAMGLTDEQSKHTANVINELSNAMSAEAGEINNIFTRMGPMMKGSGIATQDIAALATAFKAAGAECEVSATAMKNFVKAMAAGSAGLTDEKIGIYRYLKIDPDALQKELYHDSKSAILRVLTALQNVNPEERNMLSSKLFGEESIAAISPLIEQLGTLREAYKIANSEVDGSVDDEYANRMKTTATAIGQATQSMRNLGVTAGNALLPAVGFVAKGISSLASGVDSLVKRFPNLSSGVMIAGAALATFAVGSLMFGLVLNTIKTGLNGFRGGLLRLSAAHIAATTTTTASTAAAGGFGVASRIAGAGARFFAGGLRSILVATGVGALLVGLGFAINLLIDNWDAVVASMSGAWAWVKDTWGRLGVFFTQLGKNLGSVFSGWGEALTGWVKPAWGIVTSVWNGITTYYSWLFGGIATIATTVWGTIAGLITSPVETVKNVWQTITGFFSGLWNGIVSIAASAVNGVCGVWSGATAFFGAITQGISAMFAWASSAVTTVWSGVSAFFGSIGQFIQNVFGGAWQYVIGLATWAWSGISGIWNGAIEFFSGIVAGISSVFTGLFNWLREKFAWVFSTIDTIRGFVGKVVGAVKDAANTAFGDKKTDGDSGETSNSAAKAAVNSDEKPVAPNAAAVMEKPAPPQTPSIPQMPQMPSAAQGASENPAGRNIPMPGQQPQRSYADWKNEQEAAKKGKSGGGRKKSSGGAGGGSRSGSAKKSKSGPVTVVTLDSGNEIKTQFFPAGSRTAAPNANAAASRPAAPNTGSAGGLSQTAPSGQQERGFLSGAVSALKSSGIGAAIGQGLQTGIGMAKSALGLGQKSPTATPVSTIQTGKPPVLSISSDSKPVATVSATSRPALPQAPSLIARKQKPKPEAKQSGQQPISIDLTQNFDLITQDAATAKKVLEAIKPDFEALVRKALAKINSDRTRTAYGQ